mmetsp:Transcript_85944/g.188778  ORF Transcript_85944/g.188778 Transcript_85944/m.188778 type:complete len:320 (+) Transcript_85944:117-1076(+)
MAAKRFSTLAAGVGMLMGAAEGKSALLLIDVQDCFMSDATLTANGQAGSLGVDAASIIPVINSIRSEKSCLFDKVFLTRDFHPKNHISFASTHGLEPFAHTTGLGGLPIMCTKPDSGSTNDASCCPKSYVDKSSVDCTKSLCPPDTWDYDTDNAEYVSNSLACTTCKINAASCYTDTQMMWTDHCLQTGDSGLIPSLTVEDTDIIVKKGQNVFVDAYSAFMDNSGNLKTELDDMLQAEGITTLYIAGIATDVCVQWTVRDALSESTGSYTVKLISDACAGITDEGHASALAEMATWSGVTVMTSEDILAMTCEAEATPT